MKIMYLLSGPDLEKGFEGEIAKYLKKDLHDSKSVCYIASSPDEFEANDKYFKICKKCFIKLNIGLEKFKLIDNRINIKDVVAKASGTDVIFLPGGDPRSQIKYFLDSKFNDFLSKFNGIVIGVSAGSMNMGKKVYHSKDDDYPESFIYDGLGLVDVTVDPHFDPNDASQVAEFIKFSKKLKIIGLPNQSSIRVADEILFIGPHYKAKDLKLPDEKSLRFIAILNKKVPTGKLMNALGHMAAGLAGKSRKTDDMCFLEYQDKDGGIHPNISHFDFIVLKADNSNKIRIVRNEAIKRGIIFTDFTSTMTIGTSKEQQASTKETFELDLEYYGICLFGKTDELKEFTGKFGLFQ